MIKNLKLNIPGWATLMFIILCYSSTTLIAQCNVVSTIAGDPTPDDMDGVGSIARFYSPSGMAIDGAGNIIIADADNHKIRKITPAGVVSTIAGDGTSGYLDGNSASARFNQPYGIAIEATGNIIVTDGGNNRIRKITPSGMVSTIAGDGTSGYQDGNGTVAKFNFPSSVAIDGAGNMMVADTDNHRIRKITPAGVVSTIAGDGSPGFMDGNGTSAKFGFPSGVAVDGADNIIVVDNDNFRIRKISPAGMVSTIAGDGSPGYMDGNGTSAKFGFAWNVAIDVADNIIITDANRIRKITPAGVVSTIAGDGTYGYQDGNSTTAKFRFPYGVAIDGAGNIFISDITDNVIRKLTPAGIVSTIAGDGTIGFHDGSSTSAKFNFPSGIAIDGVGNMIVADAFNNRIRKITPAGIVSTIAGDGTFGHMDGNSALAKFDYPSGVAIDGAGNIIVADQFNNRIRKITPAGIVSTVAGDGTFGYQDGNSLSAKFRSPSGVAIDGAGNIIVADQSNDRIRKITPAGIVSTIAGDGTPGYMDGNGTSAQFHSPNSVVVDLSGNILVADASNSRIRKITPAGVVSTIAGDGTFGFQDGNSTLAKFDNPSGIAIDGAGNIIVADQLNQRIRKITPAGVVATIAGDGTYGFLDGLSLAAKFRRPSGVAIDGAGNIIIVDQSNNKIRKMMAVPNSVTTDQTVLSNLSVYAKNFIEMQPNFSVTQPAVFEAVIVGCPE